MKKQLNTFYGKKFKSKLIYQMSRDGNNKESMQNKIKNHSNIIVIVKTNENKIFGGYTSLKIEYNNKWKKDNKSFLYSVDLNKKFNKKENKYAVSDNNDNGIALMQFFFSKNNLLRRKKEKN